MGNGKWTSKKWPRGPIFHGVERYSVGIRYGPGAGGKWTRLTKLPNYRTKKYRNWAICLYHMFRFLYIKTIGCRLSHTLWFLQKCYSSKESNTYEGYTNLRLLHTGQKNACIACFAMHRLIPTTICRRHRFAECGREGMVIVSTSG